MLKRDNLPFLRSISLLSYLLHSLTLYTLYLGIPSRLSPNDAACGAGYFPAPHYPRSIQEHRCAAGGSVYAHLGAPPAVIYNPAMPGVGIGGYPPAMHLNGTPLHGGYHINGGIASFAPMPGVQNQHLNTRQYRGRRGNNSKKGSNARGKKKSVGRRQGQNSRGKPNQAE